DVDAEVARQRLREREIQTGGVARRERGAETAAGGGALVVEAERIIAAAREESGEADVRDYRSGARGLQARRRREVRLLLGELRGGDRIEDAPASDEVLPCFAEVVARQLDAEVLFDRQAHGVVERKTKRVRIANVFVGVGGYHLSGARHRRGRGLGRGLCLLRRQRGG